MKRTGEPGEWVKSGRGVWVARADDPLTFKMVVRSRCGAIYASVQEHDGAITSADQVFGGFASVKDAKAWCDRRWAKYFSAPAKARAVRRRIAELQRELASVRAGEVWR